MNTIDIKTDQSLILHVEVRIESLTPTRAELSILTGWSHPKQSGDLKSARRTKNGDMALNPQLLVAIVEQLRPIKVSYAEGVTLRVHNFRHLE